MHTAPGFYGKLPARGDFVRQRLPAAFVDPWDAWLQAGIAHSREQLGEGWTDVYLVSPVWHFALSPGICGDDIWLGSMIPSVDKVGRYFPLTVAVAMNRMPAVQAVQETRLGDWFAEVDNLLFQALENHDFEAFDQGVADLEPPLFTAWADLSPPVKAWSLTCHTPESLAQCCDSLENLPKRYPAAYSLWWCNHDDGATTLLWCEQLPTPQHFSALLNEAWQDCGWKNVAMGEPSPSLAADDEEKQKAACPPEAEAAEKTEKPLVNPTTAESPPLEKGGQGGFSKTPGRLLENPPQPPFSKGGSLPTASDATDSQPAPADVLPGDLPKPDDSP